jgi:hypothetical protein
VKYAIADSIRALIVSFLSYLELRLKLLGLEAREVGLHLLINRFAAFHYTHLLGWICLILGRFYFST